MTDPTPTRAEVLSRRLREPAFGTETTERNLMSEAADTIAALRERAEAAENAHLSLCEAIGIPATALSHVEYAAQLTTARRAEAAAWNDAIEAAGNLESIHGYSNAVPRHRIRALRRAAPTAKSESHE